MPRARQIKPGLLQNGELFEVAGSDGALFFVGLWTLADREGRLEDRPLTIKATGCPLVSLDPDETLWKLHERGFVLRYECEGRRFIQIVNFRKHQSPHKDEPASILPPLEGFEHPWCVKTGSNVTWYPALLRGAPVDAQLQNLTGRVPLPCSYGSPTVDLRLSNGSPTVAVPSPNSSATPITYNPLSLEGKSDALGSTSSGGFVENREVAPHPPDGGTRPKRNRRNPSVPVDPEWKLPDSLIEYARGKNPDATDADIQAFHENYITRCLAKDYRYASHEQNWKTWYRDDMADGKLPKGKIPPAQELPANHPDAVRAEHLARIERTRTADNPNAFYRALHQAQMAGIALKPEDADTLNAALAEKGAGR